MPNFLFTFFMKFLEAHNNLTYADWHLLHQDR